MPGDHDAGLEVRERIRRKGRITFAEFMEVALFGPGVGYYTSPFNIGAQGDYFTAPEAHPVFGTLLALQLHQMWNLLGHPVSFTVAEPGAGRGILARDILAYAEVLDAAFAGALRYVAMEYSFSSQPPLPSNVHLPHQVVARDLPLRGVVGCFLSNELVDSFPVHRFEVRGGRVQEVFVTEQDGALAEELDKPSTPAISAYLAEQGVSLPEGFRGEVCLAAEPWLQQLAGALERGFVLTIDYGHPAEVLDSPERSRGTLRCYYRHTLVGNPYQRVGRQDITAHVNFTHLARAGQKHGLEALGFTTQREFLLNLGLEVFLEALARQPLRQRGRDANLLAMRGLVEPGGMGEFKVLAQGKGVGKPDLDGFTRDNPALQALRSRKEALRVPLRRAEHMPLLEGQYPHLAQEFDLEEW